MGIYAKIRVTYYVVYDPFTLLSSRELRVFKLVEGQYVEMVSSYWLPEIGLGLTTWEGVVGDVPDRWLRFIDAEGRMLPTSEEKLQVEQEKFHIEREKVETERQRADAEQRRADTEQQRADEQHQKAEEERKRADAERRRAELAEAELEELRRKLQEQA